MRHSIRTRSECQHRLHSDRRTALTLRLGDKVLPRLAISCQSPSTTTKAQDMARRAGDKSRCGNDSRSGPGTITSKLYVRAPVAMHLASLPRRQASLLSPSVRAGRLLPRRMLSGVRMLARVGQRPETLSHDLVSFSIDKANTTGKWSDKLAVVHCPAPRSSDRAACVGTTKPSRIIAGLADRAEAAPDRRYSRNGSPAWCQRANRFLADRPNLSPSRLHIGL